MMRSPYRPIALAILSAATFLSIGGAPAVSQSTPPDAEATALKDTYRRPPERRTERPELAALGSDLFWDPKLSASGKMACGSCHFPQLGWATNDARSINDSGKPTSRKSQPLIGLGYMENSTPVGWDGRNASLEAQAKSSIATGSMSLREAGTPVAVEAIEERIRSAPEYQTKFQAAFPNTAIDIDTIVKAVAEFERTIEPGLAPFDRWVEGDDAAISASAKRGFVAFNTKAGCAACHGGWRFTDDNFHDIGTTTTDLGRGKENKANAAMQFAFKTPTLRSVAVRAPYMHNGSSSTLYDVVKHYEKSGIDRPSRSPMLTPIELSEQDRLDLVAFMETLTGVADGPSRSASAVP